MWTNTGLPTFAVVQFLPEAETGSYWDFLFMIQTFSSSYVK